MNSLTWNPSFVGTALLFTLLVINQVAKADDVFQKATLYSGVNSTGTNIVLNQISSSNLQSQGFDNKAKSVCITGTWIFYEDTNYNADNRAALMQHVFGQSDFCTNLGDSVSGKVSSVRYVGAPEDYKISTITFYRHFFYQGVQEVSKVDKPSLSSLDSKVSSFIITGTSPWTVYSGQNYGGSRKCIRPPYPPSNLENYPAFVGNTTAPNAAVNPIRSAKKGCY